jgi:hypothetical protein
LGPRSFFIIDEISPKSDGQKRLAKFIKGFFLKRKKEDRHIAVEG